jgi:hypothetical protein
MGQFPDSRTAVCLAELIASDLGVDVSGQWMGWRIEVRDSDGSLLSSLRVGHDDLHVGKLYVDREHGRKLITAK